MLHGLLQQSGTYTRHLNCGALHLFGISFTASRIALALGFALTTVAVPAFAVSPAVESTLRLLGVKTAVLLDSKQ